MADINDIHPLPAVPSINPQDRGKLRKRTKKVYIRREKDRDRRDRGKDGPRIDEFV